MLIVSSVAMTPASVVADSRPARWNSIDVARRHVRNVRLAAVDGGDLSAVQIDADRGKPGAGEFDRQRQADVAQSDHADARVAIREFTFQCRGQILVLR